MYRNEAILIAHLVDYMTSAAERQIEKHDRLLVQGMYFIRTHDFEPLSQAIDRSKKEIDKKVCLINYLCNRRIPYINALLMGISSYSSKETDTRERYSKRGDSFSQY